MPGNAFIGQASQPTEAELSAALGAAKPAWDGFVAQLASEQNLNVDEWKCPSIKWGWALRVKHKKRAIVWLSPFNGYFEILFIFGGKAISALGQCRLPKRIVTALKAAPKYPEGTGLRLKVKKPQELAPLMKLVEVKLAN